MKPPVFLRPRTMFSCHVRSLCADQPRGLQRLYFFPTTKKNPGESGWYLGQVNIEGTLDQTRPYGIVGPCRK